MLNLIGVRTGNVRGCVQGDLERDGHKKSMQEDREKADSGPGEVHVGNKDHEGLSLMIGTGPSECDKTVRNIRGREPHLPDNGAV